ncbi:hypothetical protein ACWEKM_21910 [Streptomyces sp. NPDC004752]
MSTAALRTTPAGSVSVSWSATADALDATAQRLVPAAQRMLLVFAASNSSVVFGVEGERTGARASSCGGPGCAVPPPVPVRRTRPE